MRNARFASPLVCAAGIAAGLSATTIASAQLQSCGGNSTSADATVPTVTCFNTASPTQCTGVGVASQSADAYTHLQWGIYGATAKSGVISTTLRTGVATSRGYSTSDHPCATQPFDCTSYYFEYPSGTPDVSQVDIADHDILNDSVNIGLNAYSDCGGSAWARTVAGGLSANWEFSVASNSAMGAERVSQTWSKTWGAGVAKAQDVVTYEVEPYDFDPNAPVVWYVPFSSSFTSGAGGTSSRSTMIIPVCDGGCADVNPISGTSDGTSEYLWVRYSVEASGGSTSPVSFALTGAVSAGGGSVSGGGFVIDYLSNCRNDFHATGCPFSNGTATSSTSENGFIFTENLAGLEVDLGRPTSIVVTRNAFSSGGPGGPGFGDGNGNGSCTFSDRAELAALVAQGPLGFDDPNYRPEYDLDFDGDIDADDLTTFDNDASNGDCCPTDVDGNGVVSVDDLFLFLDLWFATNPTADINGDGVISSDDIFLFLNLWFASPSSCA